MRRAIQHEAGRPTTQNSVIVLTCGSCPRGNWPCMDHCSRSDWTHGNASYISAKWVCKIIYKAMWEFTDLYSGNVSRHQCVSVCVCECTYACVYAYIRTHVHVGECVRCMCGYVRVCTCTSVCAYAYLYVCTHVRVHVHVCTHAFVCAHVCVHVCAYAHVCMCAHVHVCLWVCAYVRECMHTHVCRLSIYVFKRV